MFFLTFSLSCFTKLNYITSVLPVQLRCWNNFMPHAEYIRHYPLLTKHDFLLSITMSFTTPNE